MITLSQLAELLGWASVINIGILLFTTLLLILMKNTITSIHSKMFGIPENELAVIYFRYLANYKTLTLIFFICPYFAIKLIGE